MPQPIDPLSGQPIKAPRPFEANGPIGNFLDSWRMDTTIGNVAGSMGVSLKNSEPLFAFSHDPEHDPYKGDQLKGYEDYAWKFIDSKSSQQTQHIKNMIDENRHTREVLEASGAGFSRFLANVFDPINFIPIVGTAGKGLTMMRAAGEGAAYMAGGAVIQQGVVGALDPTLRGEEAGINIGMAALFGLAIGPVAAKFMPAGSLHKLGDEFDAGAAARDKGRPPTVDEATAAVAGRPAERESFRSVFDKYSEPRIPAALGADTAIFEKTRAEQSGVTGQSPAPGSVGAAGVPPMRAEAAATKASKQADYNKTIAAMSPEARAVHEKGLNTTLTRIQDDVVNMAEMDRSLEDAEAEYAEQVMMSNQIAQAYEQYPSVAVELERRILKKYGVEAPATENVASEAAPAPGAAKQGGAAYAMETQADKALRKLRERVLNLTSDQEKRQQLLGDEKQLADWAERKNIPAEEARSFLEEVYADVENTLRPLREALADTGARNPNSVGAAGVPGSDLTSPRVSTDGTSALAYTLANSGQFPWWRMQLNKLPGEMGEQVSRLANMLTASPGQKTVGNIAGGTASEQSVHSAAIVRWRPQLMMAIRDIQQSYMEYRGFGPDASVQQTIMQTKLRDSWVGQKVLGDSFEGKMTFDQFEREVSWAINTGEHAVPEVMTAAGKVSRFYKEFGDEAARLGMFDGVKDAEKQAARAEARAAAKDAKVADWEAKAETVGVKTAHGRALLRLAEEVKAEAATLRKEALEKLEAMREAPAAVGGDASYGTRFWRRDVVEARLDELRQIFTDHFRDSPDRAARVEAALDHIRRLGVQNLPDGMTPGDILPGSAKSRKIDIPNVKVFDFIETNISEILTRYTNRMAPSLEMSRKFGDHKMAGVLDDLEMQHKEHLAAAADDPVRQKALAAEWEKQKQAITDLRDMVLGTYNLPENPDAWSLRGINLAKALATTQLMGATWQASIPDAGRVAMAIGVRKFAGALFDNFAGGAAGFKLARREGDLAAVASEVALGTRIQAINDMGGHYSNLTKAERGVFGLARDIFYFNLLAPLTDWLKGFAGALIQSETIRVGMALREGKAVTEHEMASLAMLGIDRSSAIAMATMWEQAGAQRHGKLYLANTEAWESRALVEQFRIALHDAVNNAVVTPGPADRAAFMSKPMMGLIMQLKGFGISTTQRTLMAGLQDRDAKALNGMLLMIGIGYTVDLFKSPDFDDRGIVSPSRLLRAIDISGVGGVFSDMNTMLETVTANTVGLRPLLGVAPMSGNRELNWAERTGAVGGPASSVWLNAFNALTSPDLETDERARALRRTVPLNNMWFWSDLTSRAARDVGAVAEDVVE